MNSQDAEVAAVAASSLSEFIAFMQYMEDSDSSSSEEDTSDFEEDCRMTANLKTTLEESAVMLPTELSAERERLIRKWQAILVETFRELMLEIKQLRAVRQNARNALREANKVRRHKEALEFWAKHHAK